MLTLPEELAALLNYFSEFFSEQTWMIAQVLMVGAILTPGVRTVAAILRVMGASSDKQFQNYHRVLNRAKWSALRLAPVLLNLLITAFGSPYGPLVFGIDETLERRTGPHIYGRAVYRDSVRSSRSQVVKSGGLRWMCMMFLGEIPWANRVWALPFFTVLTPSVNHYEERHRKPVNLTRRATQMIWQLHRWLPSREIVIVGDSSYASFALLSFCQNVPSLKLAGQKLTGRKLVGQKPTDPKLPSHITFVTRLRLDAELHGPLEERLDGTKGRPRVVGPRLPSLAKRLAEGSLTWQTLEVPWYGGQTREISLASETAVWYHGGSPLIPLRWVIVHDELSSFVDQAFLCTNVQYTPEQILGWFIKRWQLEVTFAETRAHLGVETQRQWSRLAITRTTPILLGLFSLVTLMANKLHERKPISTRQAAWYKKELPTFSDALASVRLELWPLTLSYLSTENTDMVKVPRLLFQRLTETLAFAA